MLRIGISGIRWLQGPFEPWSPAEAPGATGEGREEGQREEHLETFVLDLECASADVPDSLRLAALAPTLDSRPSAAGLPARVHRPFFELRLGERAWRSPLFVLDREFAIAGSEGGEAAPWCMEVGEAEAASAGSVVEVTMCNGVLLGGEAVDDFGFSAERLGRAQISLRGAGAELGPGSWVPCDSGDGDVCLLRVHVWCSGADGGERPEAEGGAEGRDGSSAVRDAMGFRVSPECATAFAASASMRACLGQCLRSRWSALLPRLRPLARGFKSAGTDAMNARRDAMSLIWSCEVPAEHRDEALLLLSGAASMRAQAGEQYYARLAGLGSRACLGIPTASAGGVDRKWGEKVAREISLDVSRAFSDCEDFELRSGALARLLGAYALRHPAIGYCQGLNFIAGLLLMMVEREETAFWLLCAVCEKVNPGAYTPPMLRMQADVVALGELLRARAPGICVALASLGVPLELCASQWLLCHFVNALPPSTAAHVLQAVLVHGMDATFATAVAFVRLSSPSVLRPRRAARCYPASAGAQGVEESLASAMDASLDDAPGAGDEGLALSHASQPLELADVMARIRESLEGSYDSVRLLDAARRELVFPRDARLIRAARHWHFSRCINAYKTAAAAAAEAAAGGGPSSRKYPNYLEQHVARVTAGQSSESIFQRVGLQLNRFMFDYSDWLFPSAAAAGEASGFAAPVKQAIAAAMGWNASDDTAFQPLVASITRSRSEEDLARGAPGTPAKERDAAATTTNGGGRMKDMASPVRLSQSNGVLRKKGKPRRRAPAANP